MRGALSTLRQVRAGVSRLQLEEEVEEEEDVPVGEEVGTTALKCLHSPPCFRRGMAMMTSWCPMRTARTTAMVLRGRTCSCRWV